VTESDLEGKNAKFTDPAEFVKRCTAADKVINY
jgi:hypothetical protein